MSPQISSPTLIEHVKYERTARKFNFKVEDFTFDLELDTDALADAVEEVMTDLGGGLATIESLSQDYDEKLAPYTAVQLVQILVEQNIVTERSTSGRAESKHGMSLFQEVRAHFKSTIAPALLKEEGVQKFNTGRLTIEELKLWSIEYYFTTRFAEQCIIASVNHRTNPVLQRLFEEFLSDEIGHDRLLERSLIGFGFKEEELQSLTPHLSTVAAMGMLLHASIFDIAFFVTLIGQMEGSEESSRHYIGLLEKSGLPTEAIRPQITHEMINIENDHFGEALEMSSALCGITSSDIERCKRLLAMYISIRSSVYAFVFPGVASNRKITPALLRQAWTTFSREICKAVLPIAVANASETCGKRLARDFVELRKVELVDWDPGKAIHVAAAMLQYSLWKLSYQEADTLPTTLSWLNAVARGDQAASSVGVARHFVNAYGVDTAESVARVA